MTTDKKKLFKPRLIDGDIQIERDIFHERIQRQDLIKNHYGLKAVPTALPEESLLVRGFATVLQQSVDDIIVQHPMLDIKLVINQIVGAQYGYLISCGDYQQQLIGMIQQFVTKGDKVLEIGSGLGVTTAYIGKLTEHKVIAVEPQEKLHDIILKNCQLNSVDVDIIHASVTPENKNHEADFHIMQNYLSSSLFKESGTVDISIKVPQIAFDTLRKQQQLNTLVFDILGAEIGIIYENSIQNFNKIICILNTPIIGEEKTAHIINHLMQQGYALKNISGLVFVFIKK